MSPLWSWGLSPADLLLALALLGWVAARRGIKAAEVRGMRVRWAGAWTSQGDGR